ncbi:MAG TPA: hypothetical protein PKX78_03575 [Candidatus Woesebacteria bacterium]|jgi:hypothetical protein|nr:hypothetical protein [Candidatus Woesebacteria bacterium]
MKQIFGFLIFFAVVFYLIMVPTSRQLKGCIDRAQVEMDRLDLRKITRNYDLTQSSYCANSRKVAEEASKCYSAALGSRLVPDQIVEDIIIFFNPGFITLEQMVAAHNDKCAAHPTALFYL